MFCNRPFISCGRVVTSLLKRLRRLKYYAKTTGPHRNKGIWLKEAVFRGRYTSLPVVVIHRLYSNNASPHFKRHMAHVNTHTAAHAHMNA